VNKKSTFSEMLQRAVGAERQYRKGRGMVLGDAG